MINVFECFAGIGSQHRAIFNILNDRTKAKTLGFCGIRSVGISEFYIPSIIANDRIHNGPQNSFMNFDTLSKQTMLNYISTFSLSNDSKTIYPFRLIKKWPYKNIRELYIALIRTKNFGSIVDIKGSSLPKIDLLTYSFPCTDVSLAGNQLGIEEGSNTRSSLLWEIKRILLELKNENKLPSFLLMENVKNLIHSAHIDNWRLFESFLESLGYSNTTILLNGLQVGIPQHRERVFCISTLKGKDTFKVELPFRYTNLHNFLDLDNKDYIDEYKSCIANNTKSRWDYIESNKILNFETRCMTITTNQDRRDNAGLFLCDENGFITNDISYWEEDSEKLFYRFLTAREQLLLMGFTNKDYEALKNIDIKDSKIELMAGNSIIVNKLEIIFFEIFKKIVRKQKLENKINNLG